MQLTLPTTVQLEITDNCNFRCQHCYRLDGETPSPNPVDDETVMKTAAVLAENRIYNIIFTGGEPFTRPELLMRLTDFLAEKECNININTNLTLLSDKLIDNFIKNDVRNLLVSCPSGVPEEYNTITRTHSFSTFERKLKLLNESGIHHSINMVVNRLNVGSIHKTAEFVKSLGSTRFGATPMSLNALYPRKDLLLTIDEVRSLLYTLRDIKDELGMEIDVMEALPKCAVPEELVREGLSFTRRKCQAGLTTAAVSASGDVRPCTHNPKSYGNLLRTPFTEIWKSMSSWRDMSYIPDECSTCALLGNCHGACRINALTENGSLKGRDIWMTEKITPDRVTKRDSLLSLEPETRVRMIRAKLRTRPETDGFTLVFGRNGRQVALVNGEVLRLIDAIGEKTMSVAQIAEMGDVRPDDANLNKILNHLISRRLMKIENQPKLTD